LDRSISDRSTSDRSPSRVNLLAFPHPSARSSQRNTSSLAVDLTPSPSVPPALPYRSHPTAEELIHQSLDLSFQVDLAISHIDRQIIDQITRDRHRRLIPPTLEIPPSAQD
jgi:hypothetical protein